jgi:pilus assembly protein CpaC
MKNRQLNTTPSRGVRCTVPGTFILLAGMCLAGTSEFALAQNAPPKPPPAVRGTQDVARPPASAGPDVKISVRDMAGEGQLIRVPVNKSVLVDFSAPIREVRLAKPEFADVNAVSPTQIIVNGKSFGTTQMIVTFDGNAQRLFDVAVDLELDRLVASMRTAIPRAKVRAHALLDAVVLTGEVPDADSAERIMQIAGIFSKNVINQMKVAGTQQVLLRCTVAEMNRSTTRQLGFNGWLGGENFRDAFLVQNLNQINPANIGAAADAAITRNVPFITGTEGIPITGNATMSIGFPRVQMQIFVQALRENGLLKVLAEPNLVAINGQSASFLAGGEIPIPITTSNTTDVKFKEFGVRLNFTPAVLSEDRIRMKVTPEVSEPDPTTSVTFGGISIPGFSTRRIETVIELGSGETLAIGGLLNERMRGLTRAVPVLGDIPVLGALFRSVEFQTNESELVVLVTPELVAPISGDQVTSVPGANHVEPNDFELFLMGQLDGKPEQPVPTLQPRINHSWPVKQSDLYGSPQTIKVRGPLGPASGDEGH